MSASAPTSRFSVLCSILLLQAGCAAGSTADGTGAEVAGIRPHVENPHYLAWDGVPIFPLGATGPHGWTPISRPEVDFAGQLDRLAGVIDDIGSPHVRGLVRVLPYDPMNHMHDGEVARVLQPWVRLPDGRFDLERFDPEWEARLRAFLDAALARRIVVSLELWDDWSVTRGPGGQYDPGAGGAWNAHPFNPANNVNLGAGGLSPQTAVCEAPFYASVGGREDLQEVLPLQRRYAERLLEIASGYPNVLLDISNESRAHLDWSRFWAEFVRDRAPGVLVGEMPSTNRRDGGGECDPGLNARTLATDPRYDYVDISQAVSRHEFAEIRDQALGGGRRIHSYRQAMAAAGTRKPLLITKEYARDSEGGDIVLWSRLAGGAASARFHRPGAEHGSAVVDFQHQAIARLGRFLADVPFWRMHPAPELIRSLPEGAGANVLAEAGSEVVVQLLGGAPGERLDLRPGRGVWTVRWIDPSTGEELARADRKAAAADVTIEIPAGPPHRILHLRRVAEAR